MLLNEVEHILSKRYLEKIQSLPQKGFTTGSSSIDAALILSECTSEAKNVRKSLILATLDAQKAFDVVDHCIPLRKLVSDGPQVRQCSRVGPVLYQKKKITGDDWLMNNSMLT